LFALNYNQFIKLEKLIGKFEDFEKQYLQVYSKITRYLDILNYFFKDSCKQMTFKEDTSELTFNALDRVGSIVINNRDITSLSSGEQQLLILFSYIAFNSQDGKIFIIDEPELSLHIKWQEDFISYLEQIAPKKTQIILATHSPILVSKKKSNAVLLFPHNG